MLEGIRYDLLKELCEDAGIACNLRPIPEAKVRAADEVPVKGLVVGVVLKSIRSLCSTT